MDAERLSAERLSDDYPRQDVTPEQGKEAEALVASFETAMPTAPPLTLLQAVVLTNLSDRVDEGLHPIDAVRYAFEFGRYSARAERLSPETNVKWSRA